MQEVPPQPVGNVNVWQPPAPTNGGVTAAGAVDEPTLPPPPPSPAYGYAPQPYPPVYGYAAPPPYPYAQPQQRRYNGFAISSCVLRLIWIYGIGSILALVFGCIARRQIRDTGDNGGGLAIAGIVLGWLGAAFMVLAIIGLALSSSTPSYGL